MSNFQSLTKWLHWGNTTNWALAQVFLDGRPRRLRFIAVGPFVITWFARGKK